MCSLIIITTTTLHLAYHYVASDKFSVTEADQEAESFSHMIESTTLWNEVNTNSITKFSEGRFKFRHQLEFEHCWLARWYQQYPKCPTKCRTSTTKKAKKQKYIDYNLRWLKPEYLQLKAQGQLMEYPNATWNEFSSHYIQEDVMRQVSSNFLHDVEQIKTELATLGQEMRNLRVELQEHRVISMEGTSRARVPTHKGKQKTVQFCNYCHKIGHTPNWCRKKVRDEKIRKVRYEMYSTRNHVPTQDHGTNAPDRSAQCDQNVDLSLIRMMATPQLLKFNPLKRKPCKMNLTNSLRLNQDSFTGTMAWFSKRQNSTQLKSLTMHCPTHFRWASEVPRIFFNFVIWYFWYTFLFRNVKWLSLIY